MGRPRPEHEGKGEPEDPGEPAAPADVTRSGDVGAGVGPADARTTVAPPQPSDNPQPGPDRRRLARRAAWGYAVATPAGPDERSFEVRLTDASDAGIGFRSPQPLRPGQELLLNVRGLDVKGLELRCRVVHCAPAAHGFNVGVAVLHAGK